MGEALLAALLRAGANPSKVKFAVRRAERSAEIAQKYQIHPASLEEMASTSDVLLLVMKPYDLENISTQIAPHLKEGTLVISFLAGKKIATIKDGLKPAVVAMVMPNTPTLLGAGMSIVSYGEGISPEQKQLIQKFLDAAGKSIEIDEQLQDAATATSGSGPAYFFAFVEAMVEAAIGMGIDQDSATMLVTQTIVGAAKMLESSGKSATTLRENVTSPNGVTFQALKVFNESDLKGLVAKAMRAAAQRSQEMA